MGEGWDQTLKNRETSETSPVFPIAMRYLPVTSRKRIALEFFSDSQSSPECFTFESLNHWIERYASLLYSRGIRRGQRAGIFLPNSPELIVSLFGNHLLGVVTVPINPASSAEELSYMTRRAEISALISSVSPPFKVKLHVSSSEFWDALERPVVSFPANKKLDHPALLCFTSGTTARPKGVVLTHRNLRSNLSDLIQVWKWTERDRFLLSLPLFHVHGIGVGLHGWAMTGCSLLLTHKFDAQQVLGLLEARRCTLFMGVPTMYQRMVEACGKPRRPLSSLRLAISGSGPMSVELHEQFRRIFGKRILERYGMTETMMNTSNPLRKRKPGSVGLPLPSVRVKLVNESLQVIREPNQPGELCIRGPNVFKGYWKDAGASRRAFAQGWFRTGDLGYRDPEGYYYLLGRIGLDFIKSGGYRIGAREIEAVLERHPAVREAAVVGLPDHDLGEKIAAFVVADREAHAEDLQSHCRQYLASYKCPRVILRVDSLPRNSMGKILKSDLKKDQLTTKTPRPQDQKLL